MSTTAELLNGVYEAQRETIESERNRPREEFEKDLLYHAMFDKPNYDRLVLRLSLSALLDLREQNARIIELLQPVTHVESGITVERIKELMKRSGPMAIVHSKHEDDSHA